MEFKVDKDFAESAEKLLGRLNYHNYLFDSGISLKSNCKEILDDHRELFDTNILADLDTSKYSEEDHYKIELFKVFVSNLIQNYNGSGQIDKLKNEFIKQAQDPESKGITLLNLLPKIKTERKREKRNNLGRQYSELIKGLYHNLELTIEKKNEASTLLGCDNYIYQIRNLSGLEIEGTEKLCSEFLSDTEYIYKDLLGWQLKNKLEIRIEDARHEDILFLFNSHELKDYFKQTSADKLSTRFLGEIGINLPGSITFDLNNRLTKNPDAQSYAVSIPDNILISVNRIKTAEDYDSILGELGISLMLSSINIEESFLNKRLIDSTTLQVFRALFGNLIYEHKWLGRYLRIDTDNDFLGFLYMKKLVIMRMLCIKALSYRVIYENDLSEAQQEIYGLVEKDFYIKPNENIFLLDLILTANNPYTEYKACLLESHMREFLISRFDEQWWRDPGAGDEIIKWWNKCIGLTPRELQKQTITETLSNKIVISNFEKVF